MIDAGNLLNTDLALFGPLTGLISIQVYPLQLNSAQDTWAGQDTSGWSYTGLSGHLSPQLLIRDKNDIHLGTEL